MSDQPPKAREPRRSLRHTPKSNNNTGDILGSDGDSEPYKAAQDRKQRNSDATTPADSSTAHHTKPRHARGGGKGRAQKTQVDGVLNDKPTRPRNETRASQPNPARTTSHPTLQSAKAQKDKVTTTTPAKTPSRPYAGPAFHCSPAPSSLPLPRMISQSVPNVNKMPSFMNYSGRRHEDAKSENEESIPNGAAHGQNRQTREESPLDILFQADRAAKAKLFHKQPEASRSKSLDPFNPRAVEVNGSLSPSRPPRHHTRTHTDGNAGSVFSMEMENGSQEGVNQTEIEENKATTEGAAVAAPDEDPLLAKTRALKQLLNFSGTYQTSTSARTIERASNATTTPLRNSQTRASARLSGTPPVFPNGIDGSTPEDRQRALLALAEKQIASPGVTSQRPPSSGLRQELKKPASPVTAQELLPPSTPTPSNRQERHRPSTRKHPAPTHQPHSTPPTMSAGNVRPKPSPMKSNDSSMKSIEDDLRRMLKLDVLPSDGVSRV